MNFLLGCDQIRRNLQESVTEFFICFGGRKLPPIGQEKKRVVDHGFSAKQFVSLRNCIVNSTLLSLSHLFGDSKDRIDQNKV